MNKTRASGYSLRRWDGNGWLGAAVFCLLVCGLETANAQYPSLPQITNRFATAVSVEDYASLPISSRTLSNYPPVTNFSDQLGRVNFLRSEPSNAPLSSNRFFVADQNRNLYILDKATRTFTVYINFEEVFRRFDNNPGYSAGLVTFAFDPDYASNHIFYTVHTEDPTNVNSAIPTSSSLPGLNTNGYSTTAAMNPPAGAVAREAVLVEWTDTNITNATFEGTAREIMRVGFTSVIHPMGDLLFNPLAQPGDPDWRNLYIAMGDGEAGETPGVTHTIPQRLDAVQGKILRITPDINLRTADELSTNGRYRIPTTGVDPNPFVSITLTNLKKEIFAYGFRNPHRFSWDPVSNRLIVDHIGLNSWEALDIIHKGSNYGWAEREGTEQVFIGGTNNEKTGSQTTPPTPFPTNDTLVVTGLSNAVTPTYPAAEYSHRDGDALSSGFVYRGTLLPALVGKYITGDITTARLFFSDLTAMISADDTNRTTVAPINEIRVLTNGVQTRMFDVVAAGYTNKGGHVNNQALPGQALDTGGNDPYGVAYGKGRADIRIAQGGDGELYILSKSDGWIRRMTAILAPPTIQSATVSNTTVTLTWPSIKNRTYRVQFLGDLTSTNWTSVSGDVTATGTNAFKTDTLSGTNRFYRVVLLP